MHAQLQLLPHGALGDGRCGGGVHLSPPTPSPPSEWHMLLGGRPPPPQLTAFGRGGSRPPPPTHGTESWGVRTSGPVPKHRASAHATELTNIPTGSPSLQNSEIRSLVSRTTSRHAQRTFCLPSDPFPACSITRVRPAYACCTRSPSPSRTPWSWYIHPLYSYVCETDIPVLSLAPPTIVPHLVTSGAELQRPATAIGTHQMRRQRQAVVR